MAPMALDLAVEELNSQSSKPPRLRRQQRLKCTGETSTAKHQGSVGVDKNRTGGPPLIKIGNGGSGFWESSQSSVLGTSGALKIRGCGSMDTKKQIFHPQQVYKFDNYTTTNTTLHLPNRHNQPSHSITRRFEQQGSGDRLCFFESSSEFENDETRTFFPPAFWRLVC